MNTHTDTKSAVSRRFPNGGGSGEGLNSTANIRAGSVERSSPEADLGRRGSLQVPKGPRTPKSLQVVQEVGWTRSREVLAENEDPLKIAHERLCPGLHPEVVILKDVCPGEEIGNLHFFKSG